MPRKRCRREEIIAKLRRAEVLQGEGKKVPEVTKVPERLPEKGGLWLADGSFIRLRREHRRPRRGLRLGRRGGPRRPPTAAAHGRGRS